MNTIFLRFPDEATFLSTMPATFVRYGETGYPLPDGVTAISIVGALYIGGSDVVALTLVPGFHVNMLASTYTTDDVGDTTPVVPQELIPYQITPDPNTPARVFG